MTELVQYFESQKFNEYKEPSEKIIQKIIKLSGIEISDDEDFRVSSISCFANRKLGLTKVTYGDLKIFYSKNHCIFWDGRSWNAA